MRTKIVFLLFFFCSSLRAQDADSIKTIDSINVAAMNFLIHVGEMDQKVNKDQLSKQFHFFEVVTSEPLGFSKIGVYGFRAYKSPSTTYILIKNKTSYKILDLYDISNSLKVTIKFLEKQQLSRDEIVMYTQSILDLYKSNRYGKHKL